MALIDTRYGPLALPDGGADLIGQHLARYGEWAWCEAEFIASVLDEGARLLDGGAYIGTFGLGVAQQVRLGFLCAVEGNRRSAQYLQHNLARLSPCPTELVEAILVGNETVAESGHATAGNLGSTSFVVTADDTGEMTVEAASRRETLADLRTRFGAFDMIKLDIEGMELPVLRADAATLRAGETAIWVECNETVRSLHLADFLLSLDLPLWYFAFPSHDRKNVNGIADAIFPMGFEAGLLAAPKREPSLPANLVDEGCVLRRIGSVGALREAMWLTPRWGRPGWEKARSREELAAIAGRELLGQNREAYLVAPETGVPAAQSLWDKLSATEIALMEARNVIAARELAEAKAQAAVAEMAAEASSLRDACARAEAARAELEQALRAAETKAAAAAVQASTAQDACARAEMARTAVERELRAAEARAASAMTEAMAAHDARAQAEAAEAARAAMEQALLTVEARAARATEAARAAEAEAARQAGRRLELLARIGEIEESLTDQPRPVAVAGMVPGTAVMPSELVAELHGRLRDIETSTSWIVTAPLRAVIGRSTALRRTLRMGRTLAGKAVRGLRNRPDR